MNSKKLYMLCRFYRRDMQIVQFRNIREINKYFQGEFIN